jgi:hypothetical protein
MFQRTARPFVPGVAVLCVLFAVALVAETPQTQPGGRGQGQGAQGSGAAPGGQGRGGRGAQRPARDAVSATPAGTGSISGRVVAADTGRPVKRARVLVAGGGRPRAATTDDQGRYSMTALPPASYTITATKTGFVDGIFGQRRALQSGTPIDLADGQQIANIEIRIARGGVVTGRVLDEDGEPLARALVTVLRQQYVRGEKQLTTAGTDQSDDRGQYRVFGLPPGDYYVSATVGGLDGPLRPLLAPGAGGGPGARGTPGGPGGPGVDQAPASTGYAPTYYPGVVSAADAARVKVAPSQEVSSIDFQLQLVPLATVKGMVVGGSATVMMVPEEGATPGGGRGGGGRGVLAAAFGGLRAAARQDGTFSIANVTPGRYTIIARADGGPNGGGRTASASIVVAGDEVNVVLSPAPGVQMSGTITLEASTTPVPQSLGGFRVTPTPIGSLLTMPRPLRPAEGSDAGSFAFADVMPGRYAIRGSGPSGWMMKTVYLDGRDVTDQPIEVKTDSLTGLNVIFTDRISRLNGTVRSGQNAAAGITVIAFPSDDRLWLPQSRQIVTTRTDQSGSYRIGAIPAGEYLVIAVDDVEQGEWFDPAFLEQIRTKANRVTIGEGETRTEDLKVQES